MIKKKQNLLVLLGISFVLVLCLIGRFQLSEAGENRDHSLTEETDRESAFTAETEMSTEYESMLAAGVPGEKVWIDAYTYYIVPEKRDPGQPGETVWIDENTYYVVPEDTFNPLTASNEELKKRGYPERPDDPEGLAQWKSLYVHTPIWVEPEVMTFAGGIQHQGLDLYEEPDPESSADPEKHWLNENTYYLKPPQVFNPLLASDEDLKKYGFPERPDDPEGLAFWESLYKTYPEFVDPEIEEGKEPLTSLPEMLPDGAKAVNSNNWAGVIHTGNAYGANAVITVPSVSTTGIYKPAHCASWTGIGGTTTAGALAQLGCDGIINSDGSVQYKTFYETINTSVSSVPYYIYSLSISPGDNLFVSVWLDYTSSGTIDIHYYFHNITKNLYDNVVVSNVSSYSGITASAEWIMERPVFGGSYTYLAKPMTSSQAKVNFSSCSYKKAQYTSTWNNNPSGTVYNMVNYLTGNNLASGSSFSSGAMNVSWLDYN